MSMNSHLKFGTHSVGYPAYAGYPTECVYKYTGQVYLPPLGLTSVPLPASTHPLYNPTIQSQEDTQHK